MKKNIDCHAIEKKFLAFHKENPEVLDILVDLALQAKRAGKRKIGIKMLWEVMRWNRFLETNDPDGYKLNNNFPSRYARLMMENHPELDGLFEIRKLRS